MTVFDDRASVQLVDENGDPYGVKQIDGKARVSSEPYLYDIAEGAVPGHSGLRKFGRNPDVGTSRETIWDAGGLYAYPSSAIQLHIVSTDVADIGVGGSEGTGARTVSVEGLDTNWAALTETVTLNGTTAVTTTGSFLRVFRMKVLTAGSGGFNAGTITAKDTTDTVTYAQIEIDNNQTLMAVYSVADGKSFYVSDITISTDSDKGTETLLFVREFGGVFQVKYTVDLRPVG